MLKKILKNMVVGAAATGMLLASSVMAADQKIALVNLQEVMQKVPQTVALMQAVEIQLKEDITALEKIKKDIDYYGEKIKRDGPIMAETEKKELIGKINELNAEGSKIQQGLQGKKMQGQQYVQSQVGALILKATNELAAKDGYDLVLAQQAVIYAKPDASNNITEAVIESVSKMK